MNFHKVPSHIYRVKNLRTLLGSHMLTCRFISAVVEMQETVEERLWIDFGAIVFSILSFRNKVHLVHYSIQNKSSSFGL